MIRAAWRRSVSFLVSAPLVVGLLVFIGVWPLVATLIAQGGSSSPEVVAWAKAHPLFERIVRAVGLHQAFTSPIFMIAVLLLALSTVICSWRRTKVALGRARKLREAVMSGGSTLAEAHDAEVAIDPLLGETEACDRAADALRGLGIKTERSGGALRAVSSPWTVWGSPVFHWALVAFIVAVLVGQLVRSEGSIALAVGQTKPNTPASYDQLHVGPWHTWKDEHRSVRLDAFEPDYRTGGIDRGAVPTVSLLDAKGRAIVTQRVYQNMMLHDRSLSINAPGVGLATGLVFLSPTGVESGRAIQYLEFSQTTSGGTLPVSGLVRKDSSGRVAMKLYASVPLEGTLGHYGEWIPRAPRVRVVVVSGDGRTLVDSTAKPGEAVALPGGGTVRPVGVGWYSRLSLVDDPTIPFIYGSMVVAMIGLAMTVAFRQQLVLAKVVHGPDGAKLAIQLRLWRNVPTSRDEIMEKLTKVLSGAEKEHAS